MPTATGTRRAHAPTRFTSMEPRRSGHALGAGAPGSRRPAPDAGGCIGHRAGGAGIRYAPAAVPWREGRGLPSTCATGMFPTVLHRSPSRVPRQVRDQLGVLPRDFLAAPARRVLRTPGRSRTDAVDGGARVAGRHRRGGNPEWAGCPPSGPAQGASALAVVDPAAGRLARTTGGPHEVTAGRTGN